MHKIILFSLFCACLLINKLNNKILCMSNRIIFNLYMFTSLYISFDGSLIWNDRNTEDDLKVESSLLNNTIFATSDIEYAFVQFSQISSRCLLLCQILDSKSIYI